MGDLLTFKKLNYMLEAEEVTSRILRLAFWPLKIVLIITIISFIVFYFMGYGNFMIFTTTSLFTYLALGLFLSSLWLILNIRLGLKCPNCHKSFFKFSKKLEIKPACCPYCQVIFVKKTHPIEDDYDYSEEFWLLKKEVERRADLALFYLTVGVVFSIFILIPILTSLLGSMLTIFVIIPVILIVIFIYLIKQLETKCPSCSEYIKWTDLKPTEISQHCPHCNVKLSR